MFSSFDDLECVNNLCISGSYFFERSSMAIDIHTNDININNIVIHVFICCNDAPNNRTPPAIGNI